MLSLLSLAEADCAKKCISMGALCQGFAYRHNVLLTHKEKAPTMAPCTLYYDYCQPGKAEKLDVLFFDKKSM